MRLAAVLVLAACGGAPATADAPDVFIAVDSSFQGYTSWNHFHSDGPPDDGTYTADVLGPREQYINNLPPSGATEFPIGTMIVEDRASVPNVKFAGVKRGGGYNSSGALNWEWFALTVDANTGVVVHEWRGVGPPKGDTYGGDPNGGCNACHAACGLSNDYVCSGKLQLANF